MTPNAKSYAGLVMAQEGKVFTSPKVDIKGLQIKKVSAAKETRRYFTALTFLIRRPFMSTLGEVNTLPSCAITKPAYDLALGVIRMRLIRNSDFIFIFGIIAVFTLA